MLVENERNRGVAHARVVCLKHCIHGPVSGLVVDIVGCVWRKVCEPWKLSGGGPKIFSPASHNLGAIQGFSTLGSFNSYHTSDQSIALACFPPICPII